MLKFHEKELKMIDPQKKSSMIDGYEGEIGDLAKNLNAYSKEDLLDVLAGLAPKGGFSNSDPVPPGKMAFVMRLLEIKIQEEFQEKMLKKQTWLVTATCILAVGTIVTVFISLA